MAESLGNLARIEGFQANLWDNGKQITVLPSGKTFMALIRSEPDIDPSALLGSDIREKNVIETLRSYVPSELLAASARSQFQGSCDGVKFSFTKRSDNVANPFVSFEVVKVL